MNDADMGLGFDLWSPPGMNPVSWGVWLPRGGRVTDGILYAGYLGTRVEHMMEPEPEERIRHLVDRYLGLDLPAGSHSKTQMAVDLVEMLRFVDGVDLQRAMRAVEDPEMEPWSREELEDCAETVRETDLEEWLARIAPAYPGLE